MIRSGRGAGMQTLEDALNELVASGRVSYEDAVRQAMRPDDIERLVSAPAIGRAS